MRHLILLFAMLIAAPSLIACCMVPKTYQGDVDQSEQRVLIVHDDGQQEMLIQVNPFFKPLDSLYYPTEIKWVITVPNRPDAYAEADKQAFYDAADLNRRLQDLARKQYLEAFPPSNDVKSAESARALKSGAAAALDISEPIQVGNYEIYEVQAKDGRASLTALNTYLADGGFPEEDPDHMAYFVDNNFTFLCMTVKPRDGSQTLAEVLDMHPLSISFKSDKPYYPGKFSSQQGNFSLNLSLITSEPIDKDSWRAIRQRLSADTPQYTNLYTDIDLPDTTYAMFEKSPKAGEHEAVKRWYVNEMHSRGFNPIDEETGKPRIASWEDDVFFTLGSKKDLPPDWYKGDVLTGGVKVLGLESGSFNNLLLYGGLLLLGLGLAGVVAIKSSKKPEPEPEPEASE